MLWFISAVYNEENEIIDLLDHVKDYVYSMWIADDGSTDKTLELLKAYAFSTFEDGFSDGGPPVKTVKILELQHIGLPETVKHLAKEQVPDGSWILMLDADERLHPDTLAAIKKFTFSAEGLNWDYVYFNQLEIIDGVHVRTFQKCKLFRKEAISFPLNNIHADDQFDGRGTYKEDWLVFHRKTSDKQKQREREYLKTYKDLLDEGHIDEGRFNWLKGLHHYEKE